MVQEGTFGRVLRGIYRDPYARAALNVIIKTVSGMLSAGVLRLIVGKCFNHEVEHHVTRLL